MSKLRMKVVRNAIGRLINEGHSEDVINLTVEYMEKVAETLLPKILKEQLKEASLSILTMPS